MLRSGRSSKRCLVTGAWILVLSIAGAATPDINQDGRLDVVLNQIWFEHPGGLAGDPDTP